MILETYIFVHVVEKNHALACHRVMKRAARILGDQ